MQSSRMSRFVATILVVVALEGFTLSSDKIRCQRRRYEGASASALQIIFSFEARSDLLDHLAAIGIVY
jgi:hypothetical protein